MFFFLLITFSQVYFSIWYKKKTLYANDKHVYQSPKRLPFLVQPCHSIKGWQWLSFYRVIERFLSLSQHFLLNFVYSTIYYKKNIFVNVKYVYEGPKNGQTVVICSTLTRCAEPQHKSLLLSKVLSRDGALYFPFTTFFYLFSSTLQFGIQKKHIFYRKVCL